MRIDRWSSLRRRPKRGKRGRRSIDTRCAAGAEEASGGLQAHGRQGRKDLARARTGALDYRECVGDDLSVEFGLPFAKLVKPKAGEAIMFSWIVFKSRAHRDKVNARVMADKRLQKMPKVMPFDAKRMSFGGFKTLVSA